MAGHPWGARGKAEVIGGEIWLIDAHAAEVAAATADFSAPDHLIAQNGGPNIVDSEDLPACSGESLSYSSR